MAPKQRAQSGARRGVLIAAVAGWIAVVVIAAGQRSEETALLGVKNLDVVYLIALSLLALVGLVFLIVLWPRERVEGPTPPKRKRGAGWLFAVLVLVLLVWRPELIEELADETNVSITGLPAEVLVDETAEVDRKPVAELTDILLLVCLVAVCAAAWAWIRRSGSSPLAELGDDEEGARFEADLAAAMETATAELLADGDPRSAVLNAYATLEAVLAARGTRRVRPETATEHIGRALSGLSIDPAPLVRLGELYEIARFSDREITVADQRDAASALDAARAQLQASSGPAAT